MGELGSFYTLISQILLLLHQKCKFLKVFSYFSTNMHEESKSISEIFHSGKQIFQCSLSLVTYCVLCCFIEVTTDKHPAQCHSKIIIGISDTSPPAGTLRVCSIKYLGTVIKLEIINYVKVCEIYN